MIRRFTSKRKFQRGAVVLALSQVWTVVPQDQWALRMSSLVLALRENTVALCHSPLKRRSQTVPFLLFL